MCPRNPGNSKAIIGDDSTAALGALRVDEEKL